MMDLQVLQTVALASLLAWRISLLSPATYAASALRQVVLNMPDRIPLVVDLLVLTGVTTGLLWVVNNRLDWRGRA